VSQATLTINSRNYGAWSLRGWLMCRLAGLEFTVAMVPSDDPSSRAELLALSPSFLVPRLEHDGVAVWGTLAIAEYLEELLPEAGLLPPDAAGRARCRSICGEMHSGFVQLRSALPMNIKSRHPEFSVWGGAGADIDRVVTIWRGCLEDFGGPFLFGARPTMADAMYAPVVTRFRTYDVQLDEPCVSYCATVLEMPDMVEWIRAAEEESEDLSELDIEF
jgi:glutathione S-transferase